MYSSMRIRSTLAVVVAMFLIAFSNHQSATAQQMCTTITSAQISSTMNQHCGHVTNSAPNGTALNPECCNRIRDLFNPPCLCSHNSTLAVPKNLLDLAMNNCKGVIVPRELPRCPALGETCRPITKGQLDDFDKSCPEGQFADMVSISYACCWRLRHHMINGAACLCSSPRHGFVISENLSKAASKCNVNLTREIRKCQGYN